MKSDDTRQLLASFVQAIKPNGSKVKQGTWVAVPTSLLTLGLTFLIQYLMATHPAEANGDVSQNISALRERLVRVETLGESERQWRTETMTLLRNIERTNSLIVSRNDEIIRRIERLETRMLKLNGDSR